MAGHPPCPCDSGRPYARCCGPIIDVQRSPETAEQLMRARYTAYTLAHEDFLLRTWHPAKPQPRHPCRAALASIRSATRPQVLGLRAAAPVKWLGLTILRTDGGGPQDIDGTVEFVARYKPSGRADRLHEVSRFVRENHQWFYVEGEVRSVAH